MRTFIRLSLLILLTSCPAASQAKWLEASTRHFVIYSEQGANKVRELAERLERFDAALRHANGVADRDISPANRLTVVLFRSQSRVQAFYDGDTSVDGFYSNTAGRTLAVANTERVQGHDALFHEYAHHFISTNYSVALPMWLAEGYAEFYATAEVRADGSVELGLPNVYRAYDLGSAARVPVEKLVGINGNDARHTRLSLYASGWLLMHYLNFEPARQGQLRAYLKALEAGQTTVAAATTAFGDLRKLDDDLGEYVGRPRLSYLRVAPPASEATRIALRELSAAEQAVMPLRIRLQRGVQAEQALAIVSRARTVAARFPTQASAQLTLAMAEFAAGHHEAAAAAAARAMADTTQRADALVYQARAQMAIHQHNATRDAETWANVREQLVQANRIEPDDPEPLILFYLSFGAAGQTPTANAILGLERAFELAPQDPVLGMITACQALREGDFARARKPLALVANDPHGAALATTAAELLNESTQPTPEVRLERCQQADLQW
jgi:hypothetical protein